MIPPLGCMIFRTPLLCVFHDMRFVGIYARKSSRLNGIERDPSTSKGCRDRRGLLGRRSASAGCFHGLWIRRFLRGIFPVFARHRVFPAFFTENQLNETEYVRRFVGGRALENNFIAPERGDGLGIFTINLRKGEIVNDEGYWSDLYLDCRAGSLVCHAVFFDIRI